MIKLNVETVVHERVKMTPERIKDVINDTYDQYFVPRAIQKAEEQDDDQLIGFLLRLQDFATVVEASRAMSTGDVGRMMRMWKRWSVMAHGMKRLKHYANYLPRLIILLDKTLPHEIADVLKYNLLICPSGRASHFVAKDFFLEVQNFWLKFFYNNVVRDPWFQYWLSGISRRTLTLIPLNRAMLMGRALGLQSKDFKIYIQSMFQWLEFSI